MQYGPSSPRRCVVRQLKQCEDPIRLPLGHAIHFRGSPVIGAHRFPPPARARAETGLPSSQNRLPAVFCPIRQRGPSASAPGSQTPSLAFTVHTPARHPLFRPEGRGCDDACSGFTHITDRTSAPAPLRIRPLDHARGHSYHGRRHLPGPDSHRPAVLNLSLDLRHDELHLLTTPKQSGHTCATATAETAHRSNDRIGRPDGARRRDYIGETPIAGIGLSESQLGRAAGAFEPSLPDAGGRFRGAGGSAGSSDTRATGVATARPDSAASGCLPAGKGRMRQLVFRVTLLVGWTGARIRYRSRACLRTTSTVAAILAS